jgi:hypothetical protein
VGLFASSWSGMRSPPITAALTLSLTGRYERQGTEAADGIRLWAEAADVRVTIVDDGGPSRPRSRRMALGSTPWTC